MGTFTVAAGLSSAEETNRGTFGVDGTQSSCVINAEAGDVVIVTINNNSSTFPLTYQTNNFNIILRIENTTGTNLGTSTTFTMPAGGVLNFTIDANITSSQNIAYDNSYLNTLSVTVVYQ